MNSEDSPEETADTAQPSSPDESFRLTLYPNITKSGPVLSAAAAAAVLSVSTFGAGEKNLGFVFAAAAALSAVAGGGFLFWNTLHQYIRTEVIITPERFVIAGYDIYPTHSGFGLSLPDFDDIEVSHAENVILVTRNGETLGVFGDKYNWDFHEAAVYAAEISHALNTVKDKRKEMTPKSGQETGNPSVSGQEPGP